MQGDLGFAEGYMYGEVDCTDLSALFHVRADPALVGLGEVAE